MNKNKIICTIEARMGSSRLPNKVLMEVLEKPLLLILVERLKKSKYINEIIVATSTEKKDDKIFDFCKNNNIHCFRGSENNVLDRVSNAAKYLNANIIVEITGDCPLTDPDLVDSAIEVFLKNCPTNKYVSNAGFERTIPDGFDIQVFNAKDLYEINESETDELDREHVSYKFYRPESKNIYNPLFIKYSEELNRPELFVTLDYWEDYNLIKKIYEELFPINHYFSVLDVIKWLDKNPEIRDSAKKCRMN